MQAADLHSLLEGAGEPGPYVVLGHSFGGAEAVAFASQHPDEVVGILLLDASPVTWPAAMCAVPDDGTDAAGDARAQCAAMQDPAQDPERLDVIPAFDEVAAITSLGALPITVMSGSHRVWPGLAHSELTRLDTVWSDGVDRWAGLSAESTTIFVDDTGHYIQLDQPELVVDQVLALLPSGS
jgi:pimeloyl-ACP methyl ester carboxylesterase